MGAFLPSNLKATELDQYGAAVTVDEFFEGDFSSRRRGGVRTNSTSISTFTPVSTDEEVEVFIRSDLRGRDSGSDLGLPILRGSANGGVQINGEVNTGLGTGVAIQGYTFNGDTAATLSLEVELTAFANDNAFAAANVGFYEPDDFFQGLDDVSFLVDVFENGSVIGSTFAFLNIDEGQPGPQSDTAEITVQPGQSFYLVAALEVFAGGDGVVNAENTLTTSFQPSPALDDLVAASIASVPEPSAMALAMCCLTAAPVCRRNCVA